MATLGQKSGAELRSLIAMLEKKCGAPGQQWRPVCPRHGRAGAAGRLYWGHWLAATSAVQPLLPVTLKLSFSNYVVGCEDADMMNCQAAYSV